MRGYGVGSPHAIDDTHHIIDLTEEFNGNWNDISLYDTLKSELEKSSNPQFLLVLFSKKRQDLYGVVKRVCDQWIGVHTICFVENKLLDKNHIIKGVTPQTIGNLAMKHNTKLGVQNHQISAHDSKASVSAFRSISRDTIVLGADVSHPAARMAQTPSVAAVVASYDNAFAQFSASMRLQAGTQEMIEDLQEMVYHRLLFFAQKRGIMPSRMIFYSDGISEDQFAICRNGEIRAIHRAFLSARADIQEQWIEQGKKISGQTLPKNLELTFIVVGKRHHTRFYACTEEDTYSDTRGPLPSNGQTKLNGNLKPGLVVDAVITRPPENERDKTFDFFLQSHAALKGTARSAHYTVLENDGLSVDEIQEFTYAFCHNVIRSTTSVSYAGPAYYADRLCDRGAHYLRGYTVGRDRPGIEMTTSKTRCRNVKARWHLRRVWLNISARLRFGTRCRTSVKAGNQTHGTRTSTVACFGYEQSY